MTFTRWGVRVSLSAYQTYANESYCPNPGSCRRSNSFYIHCWCHCSVTILTGLKELMIKRVQPFIHLCALVKFWVSAEESVNMTLFKSKVRKNILLKSREKRHGYHSHFLLFFFNTCSLTLRFSMNHPQRQTRACVSNDTPSVPSFMRALSRQIGVRMPFLQKVMT